LVGYARVGADSAINGRQLGIQRGCPLTVGDDKFGNRHQPITYDQNRGYFRGPGGDHVDADGDTGSGDTGRATRIPGIGLPRRRRSCAVADIARDAVTRAGELRLDCARVRPA
jgi:hypothetical protein